jgi:cyanate permease
MNWRVALIALAAVAAVALLAWLLQGGKPQAEQVEVLDLVELSVRCRCRRRSTNEFGWS